MQIGTAIIENSMEILQTTKNRVTIDSAIPLLVTYLEKSLTRNDTESQCSIIYNNQDMEATYPSINMWKCKEDALYTHTPTDTYTQWDTT